jgi:hypothetical protein
MADEELEADAERSVTPSLDPRLPQDAALRAAHGALVAARELPLAEQAAALEAVHAALSERLGDVQNA